MPVELVYDKLCPSCGGPCKASLIESVGICSSCLRDKNKESYSLNALSYVNTLEESLRNFESFFTKATGGYKLWGSQKAWAKRLLRRENTAIIAPTGIGKTTLLVAYALYHTVFYKGRVLILSPTNALAKQTFNKISIMARNVEAIHNIKILFYDSRLSKRRREELLTEIRGGDYNILIITNAFLSRHHQLLNSCFDLIIVDDVDSILNRSRNIVHILNLLGYDNEAIDIAKKIIKLRSRIMVAKINGLDDLYQKLIKEYLVLETRLYEKSKTPKGQIVIASATGRARGLFASILKSLLAVDTSGVTLYARDVSDSFLIAKGIEDVIKSIINIVKRLGKGGLILVSPHHPLRTGLTQDQLITQLNEEGIKAAKASPKTIQMLLEGSIDVIIGSCSYYGISVRGIDSPERIRYVIFVGTPVFKQDLLKLVHNPRTLYRLLLYLKDRHAYDNASVDISMVSKILRYSSSAELKLLKDLLNGRIDIGDITNPKLKEYYSILQGIGENVYRALKILLDKHKILKIGTIVLYKNKTGYIAYIPDAMTYIQATGRTSRLYGGKMTHGLSIIVELQDLKDIIIALEEKIKYFNKDFTLRKFEDIDLDKETRLIVSSRSKKLKNNKGISFKSILLVVESPTKAKTIASFFGKPARRRIGTTIIYETPVISKNTILYMNVVATRGHIFDLATDDGELFGIDVSNGIRIYYKTIKRCRICGHQFTDGTSCPRCGSSYFIDSIEIINVLRKLASEVDEVLIATDPDTEGEKIAYDAYLVIKPFNRRIYRIELHEITLRELERAMSNKRPIDRNTVEAQIYRRVLDRLIGFSISQRLWSVFGKNWLGAGRVQTPVLGWIIDHYNTYLANKCYVVRVRLGLEKPYIMVLYHTRNKNEAEELYNALTKLGQIKLVKKKEYVTEHAPKPPYTTDELLYDASKIGIPSTIAMKIAQELFESGLITYHRTDSTHVSSYGISLAKTYLSKKNLISYFKPRSWGSQGTHEAIRPTNPWDAHDIERLYSEGLLALPIYLTPLHLRLYDLIFRRFISSQMVSYKEKVYTIQVELPCRKNILLEAPVKIINHGFDTIYHPRVYSWLSKLENNKELLVPIIDIAKYKSSKHPLPTQGAIIRQMKERGIGRPSTYATTLKNLKRHGYIVFSKRRSFLIPTKTGIEVYNYLTEEFSDLVSEETTRIMEKTADLIKIGKLALENALVNITQKLSSYDLLKTTDKYEEEVLT